MYDDFSNVRFEDFTHKHTLDPARRIMAIINQIMPSLRAQMFVNEEFVIKLFKKGKELAMETEDPVAYGIMLWQSLLSLFKDPPQDLDPWLQELITVECLKIMFEEVKQSPP